MLGSAVRYIIVTHRPKAGVQHNKKINPIHNNDKKEITPRQIDESWLIYLLTR